MEGLQAETLFSPKKQQHGSFTYLCIQLKNESKTDTLLYAKHHVCGKLNGTQIIHANCQAKWWRDDDVGLFFSQRLSRDSEEIVPEIISSR